MTSGKHLCYNGKYYPDNTKFWGASNRAFRYGDSLFETIHAYGTRLQFFDSHFLRVTKGMKALGMIIPENFTQQKMEKDIFHLINKNKFFQGVRVRLSIFRNKGGLYTPSDNSFSYLIETSPLENAEYVLNRKGLTIGIYEEISKPINLLSQLKTGNALLFILAGIYSQKHGWDDCLIFNEENNLVEATSSNFFLVKDNILMTPSPDKGCIAGIMREQVIKCALNLSLTVYDDCAITPLQLLEADEIFLTNAISGIKWVVAYEQRRYFNRTAKLLIKELNRYVFG